MSIWWARMEFLNLNGTSLLPGSPLASPVPDLLPSHSTVSNVAHTSQVAIPLVSQWRFTSNFRKKTVKEFRACCPEIWHFGVYWLFWLRATWKTANAGRGLSLNFFNMPSQILSKELGCRKSHLGSFISQERLTLIRGGGLVLTPRHTLSHTTIFTICPP